MGVKHIYNAALNMKITTRWEDRFEGIVLREIRKCHHLRGS
jgi:hypothetical protein